MIYNDPNKDEHRRLILVEIGGVSIRKNAPPEEPSSRPPLPERCRVGFVHEV
jgi:hypothetical protein